MRRAGIVLLALGASAFEHHRLHKRQMPVVTETVYTTVTYCPCTTGLLSSTPSSMSAMSSMSTTSNLGAPELTSKDSMSSTYIVTPSSSSTSVMMTMSSSTSMSASSSMVSPVDSLSMSAAATTTTMSTTSSMGAPGSTVLVDASSLGDYETTVLARHNSHRRNHTAVDLVWSDTMANYAAQIAATCVYAHSKAAGDGNYGQNIGAGFTADQIAFMITNAMYNNELPNYPGPYDSDNVDTGNFGAWGHFSQIVWAGTTSVGCATQYCPNGLANAGPGIPPYFTVCNYYPAGNYVGEWSNVHAPLGGPTEVIVAGNNAPAKVVVGLKKA